MAYAQSEGPAEPRTQDHIECGGSSGQKQTGNCEECDAISVSDVSTIVSRSRRTARREQQRKKRENMGIDSRTLEPRTKDAAIQCDIMKADVMFKLKRQLARAKLSLIAAKGKIASMRRNSGLESDGDFSAEKEESEESLSIQEVGDEEEVESDDEEEEDPTEYHQNAAACLTGSGSDSGDPSNSQDQDSLDDTLEVGDVACIVNLTSAKGKELNGFYGKLERFDSDTSRFGVRLSNGSLVAIKPENLQMGMKSEEMSDEDEQLLLGLRPTPEHIRALPYTERMKALYGRKFNK